MSSTRSDVLSSSTSSFVTSLIVNMAVAGGEFAVFVVVRGWVKAIYEPRTYIPPTKKQAAVLGKNLYWPILKIIWADSEEILEKNGVDPYVFVRFLIMMTKAMIPIWLLSWIIILPLDAADNPTNNQGLDQLTFGNLAGVGDDTHRYWGHLILDYVFIFWITYLIWAEMKHWLKVRQRYLISPGHAKLAQANTVLFMGIPKEYLDEGQLAELFSSLPGGVKRIWLNRNLKDMPDLWERRMKACRKLENAQVNLIKIARKTKADREKAIAKLERQDKPIPHHLTDPVNSDLLKPHKHKPGTPVHEEPDPILDEKHLALVDQLVPRVKRPMTRLKPHWSPIGLGFLGIGQKVDTVEWARKEIELCTQGLADGRDTLQADIESPGTDKDNYPPLTSAFVRFNLQIAAHMAAQCLTHHEPYTMATRYIEQSPENVVWRNLSLNEYERSIRRAIGYAASFGLLIVWAFPVAFVGALSNVSTLSQTYPWMAWIQGDSAAKHLLQGVISGILPPVLLAVLMLVLPIILRQIIKFEGVPSHTEIERSLMTRYFIFLVVHTFFIVTLSSGIISSLGPLLQNPTSVADILANQMPTASTFFITLILTQFTGTVGTLLQPISLVLYYVKIILLGGTPRSVFNSRYTLQTQQWGTQFPGVTVYAVIVLGYMVISPVINGFGAAFFLLSTLVYKYLFIWVYDQPARTETGGAFFPKAVTHVFVGMYIQEVCLCALFFLANAIAQGALMIVLIVITVGVHYTLIVSYGPLIDAIPLSLAHVSHGMPRKGEDGSVVSFGGNNQIPTFVNASRKHLGSSNVITSIAPSSISPLINSYSEKLTSSPTTPARKSSIDRGMSLSVNGQSPTLPPVPEHQPIAMDMIGKEPTIDSYPLKLIPDPSDPGDMDSRPITESPTTTPPNELENDEASPAATSPASLASPADPQASTHSAPTAPGAPATRTLTSIFTTAVGYNKRGRSDTLDTTGTGGTIGTIPDLEGNKDPEDSYFAKPGGSGVVQSEDPDDQGNDPNAFFHPATKEPQKILWLPRDELGLCVAEIAANKARGVKTTCREAWLNQRGKVQISGPPPVDR